MALRQVQPFHAGTWKDHVQPQQCFFGFDNLEYENAGTSATFGGTLPDQAAQVVKDWLNANNKLASEVGIT